jgi:hypothetical protein
MRICRADGTVEETEMKEASAEMSLKFEAIPHMSVGERFAKLDEMADAMAKQMSEHLYGSLNDSLEKAGQVIDGKGKPFGVESVFAALEKMQVDFDQEGNPKGLQLVVGPALMPRIREMAEQEKEWRDREAARKLVG